MSKKYWVFVLCLIANSVAIPSFKAKFAPWPSLVTTTPRCPSVPPLTDLKQDLKDLANTKLEIDLHILNKLGDENVSKCKDNIVELNADEIENDEEIDNGKNKSEENKDVEKENENEENRSEENSTPIFENKAFDKAKENVGVPVPTFIPIFRPRKITVTKTHENGSSDSNTVKQAPKEKKNLVVQYVKNTNQAPDFRVVQTKNGKEDSLGTTGKNTTVFSTIQSNTLPTKPVSSNIDPANSVSFNSTSNNNPSKQMLVNAVSTNTKSTNYNLNTLPLNTNTNLLNTVSSNAVQENINHTRLPFNTLPSNLVQLNNNPRLTTFKSVPLDTDLLNPSFNIVPSTTNPTKTKTNGPTCIPSSNSIPILPIQEKPLIINSAVTPGLPLNIISSNTCSSNTISSNICPLYSSSNSIVSNTTPLKPVYSTNLNSEYKDLSNQCTDGSKNGNLVLFKPETVSVMKVEGDLLKKVTMTVLVPTCVSKLNL